MPKAKKPKKIQEAKSDYDGLGYEVIVERLESAVERLEDGGLTMDGAIAAYEEGVALAAQAQRLLDAAEQRIRELREAGD
jgi:exodeoxyribonuclease VII small subunit